MVNAESLIKRATTRAGNGACYLEHTMKNTKAKAVVEAVVEAVKIEAAIKLGSIIKLTAKTWKADTTGALQNSFWVHSGVTDSFVRETLAIDQKAVKASGVESFAILHGSKGNVGRRIELDASEKFIRFGKASGGFTGWVAMASVSAIEGLRLERFATIAAVLATMGKAERRVHSGTSYNVRFADNGSQYFASVRDVNGKAVIWHEESKRNAYNGHEISATEKALTSADVVFGETGKGKAKGKVRTVRVNAGTKRKAEYQAGMGKVSAS